MSLVELIRGMIVIHDGPADGTVGRSMGTSPSFPVVGGVLGQTGVGLRTKLINIYVLQTKML